MSETTDLTRSAPELIASVTRRRKLSAASPASRGQPEHRGPRGVDAILKRVFRLAGLTLQLGACTVRLGGQIVLRRGLVGHRLMRRGLGVWP